jgi:hypothetical protein
VAASRRAPAFVQGVTMQQIQANRQGMRRELPGT